MEDTGFKWFCISCAAIFISCNIPRIADSLSAQPHTCERSVEKITIKCMSGFGASPDHDMECLEKSKELLSKCPCVDKESKI